MTAILTSTALDAPIAAFLAHQRALGRGYEQQEYMLRALRKFLVQANVEDLNPAVFDSWCQSQRHLAANTRRARQLIVRKLCLYRRREDPHCFVPNPIYFARPHPYREPVLISPAQIARMLSCATELSPSANSPLRPAVVRLAVVLLYTAGLRRGELLRLVLDDVDARAGILRIRRSKFHKSRLVPLSADARRELRRYLRARRAKSCDLRLSAPLLCNRHHGWRRYTGTGLSGGIHELFDRAAVRDNSGRRPCIHDFRHSFAVQALLRWYRTSADVQAALPKLALYMGHVSIVSTAYYLRFIPAVARLASTRFERHFSQLIEGGAP
jgi:integrase/recombinase XerD